MKRYWVLIWVMVVIGMPMTPLASTKSTCTETVPELFRRLSPSVVSISAVSFDPLKSRNRMATTFGSGFIISEDGLILTNSHLVFTHQAISVTLDDGRMVPAELVGADPLLDLAVLRMRAPAKGLPGIRFGDSDKIEIGEEVLAIGNPFGLEQTLTMGVISGINRTLSTAPMTLRLPLIQTDAAINPGNSGGPLLNRCGEVIGMNTAMLGRAENIGFAVPINIAKRFLPQLIEKGRVIRPWVGVGGKYIKKELGEIINIPMVDGFLVETIDPESPAERAGLRKGYLPVTIGGTEFLFGGDIITAGNGQRLDSLEELIKFTRSLNVGDRVRLTLYYKGETREVEMELQERPILPGDF